MQKTRTDEEFQKYKTEQKITNEVTRKYLKGLVVWDSSRGTYFKGRNMEKRLKRRQAK